MSPKKALRGRPKGSGNKASTHGAQRAGEYAALLATGINPAAAARQVADKWRVAEATVYTDYKRHTASEEDVSNDFRAIEKLLGEMLDKLPDKLAAAIKNSSDEATIRALMRETIDSELERIGDRAPNFTSRSTFGGVFRDGLKRKPVKK